MSDDAAKGARVSPFIAPVLVDLGLGNLHSVEKSLARACAETGRSAPIVSRDPDLISRARLLVVPGQGAFRDGAASLAGDGGALGQALRAAIDDGACYLGICLGLQLLLDESEEAPGARGLGIFSGRVVRIPGDLVDANSNARAREATPRTRLKVPHMGWNQPVAIDGSAGRAVAPLLAAAGESPWFYFVHSYHAMLDDPSDVAATASYGCLEITAMIGRGRVIATQFHPEKSQRAGLAMLRAWMTAASAG